MSHSSAYPCTYCYAKKDELEVRGELRTAANVLENYSKWHDAGAMKVQAKDYYNCIHPSILTIHYDKPFLQIIPPPELYLMLGVVNTLFTHMMRECKKEALAWAEACYARREITHGGPTFKGNSCKKLLDNIDLLRREKNLAVPKYVKVFEDFI